MLELAQQPCWIRWRTAGRDGFHQAAAQVELTIFHEGTRAVALAEPMRSAVKIPAWKRLTRLTVAANDVNAWGDWRIADRATNETLLEARTRVDGGVLSGSLGSLLDINCGATAIGSISPGTHESRPLVTASGVEAVYSANPGSAPKASDATVRSGDMLVARVIKGSEAPSGLVPTDGEIRPLDFGFVPTLGADPDLVTLSLIAAVLDTAVRNLPETRGGVRGAKVTVRGQAPDGVSPREAAAGERKRRDEARRERTLREHPQLREALERRKAEGR